MAVKPLHRSTLVMSLLHFIRFFGKCFMCCDVWDIFTCRCLSHICHHHTLPFPCRIPYMLMPSTHCLALWVNVTWGPFLCLAQCCRCAFIKSSHLWHHFVGQPRKDHRGNSMCGIEGEIWEKWGRIRNHRHLFSVAWHTQDLGQPKNYKKIFQYFQICQIIYYCEWVHV